MNPTILINSLSPPSILGVLSNIFLVFFILFKFLTDNLICKQWSPCSVRHDEASDLRLHFLPMLLMCPKYGTPDLYVFKIVNEKALFYTNGSRLDLV